MQVDYQSMRKVLLQIVSKYDGGPSLQPRVVLREASEILKIHGDGEKEQALLTLWHDLFRNGQVAWGYNISNPEPPFCHVTAQGRKTLENMSRDPANPDGYSQYLSQACTLNSVAQYYVSEALKAYNSDCFRAAVMIRAAAESMVLEIVGEVENHRTATSTYTEIVGTFYDINGKVAYVGFTFTTPSDIPAGTKYGFKMTVRSDQRTNQIARYNLVAESIEYTSVPETPWRGILMVAVLTVGIVALRRKRASASRTWLSAGLERRWQLHGVATAICSFILDESISIFPRNCSCIASCLCLIC